MFWILAARSARLWRPSPSASAAAAATSEWKYLGPCWRGHAVVSNPSLMPGWPRSWNLDLRTDFPKVSASVILSVLTIQFTPMEHRLRILEDVHASLLPGGALIFVEKVIGMTARWIATLWISTTSSSRRPGTRARRS